MNETPQTLSPGPQRDEAEGYRPVSALSVAALIVAASTAFTVIGVWISAKISGKPLIYSLLLFAGGLGIVLAAAALWHIRRSQGTRGGKKLARIALWLSVLSFGAYGAYAIAIHQAVRLQAQAIADQYFNYLAENKPELAFRLTRPPERRQSIEQDPQKIRDLFGANELFAFNQADIQRMYRTWGPRARISFVGVRGQDAMDQSALEMNYVLRTPEGQFEVSVWTREFTDKATGGREWQVMFPVTRLRLEKPEDRRLTKLGRLCDELENECSGRFLGDRWKRNTSQDEIGQLLRINGQPVSDAQRAKILSELNASGGLEMYPGAGPLRRKSFPTMTFSPETDSVWLTHMAMANLPSLDPKDPRIAVRIKVKIVGKELENELLKLAGPAWEQQPLLASEEHHPEMARFKFELKVTEIDLRTDLPRIAPPPTPNEMQGPGGGGRP